MNQIAITQTNRSSKYDLEERTYQFARGVALFSKKIPGNVSNIEYTRQVIRASGSVGANYIEANESLSKKDFAMRLKISRKEAKEAVYWLRLIVDTNSDDFTHDGLSLIKEATELKKIFSSIIDKT